MSDVFISYARSTATQAQAVAEALRGLGYTVWIDDDLPAHRTYSRVIEEQMTAAKAAVVIWSADAVKSEWVLSEANRAREDRKLVQVSTDTARLPMPFDTIQCADMAGWSGDPDTPGWRKVIASIGDLVGAPGVSTAPTATVPPPLPNKPSITVLPFANLSGDPEQDYFADGMVEEITRALSRFKSIFVIGAGSGLSFKGKGVTPQEAARLLGVRYALEGSVRKAGNRVRIAVKLIDATDGVQIWADRFEDTLEDVFALQDKVALSVAGVIGTAVQQADSRRASARPTENLNSYDLYLRALSLNRVYGRASSQGALDLLDRAIALDPHYGAALSLAATFRSAIAVNGWSDDPERHLAEAGSLIRRALEVSGDDPDVLSRLAMTTLLIGGDVETAASLSDRAMALNPGSASVWGVSGVVRIYLGEPQLGFEHLETALRLDPLSQQRDIWIFRQAFARFAQGRLAETVTLLKEAAQIQPDAPWINAFLAASYGHLGEKNAADEAIARYRSASSREIRDWGTRFPPFMQKRLLDGIALAEGKVPTGASEAG